MLNKELVSVYLVTYNRSNLLKRAVLSVLNQTYKQLELIVVDDASIDDTELVIKGLLQKDKRLKYIKLKQNKGANYARNIAIKESKGRFITGLDDDDEMLPMRIETMVNVYDDRYAFVSTQYYLDYGDYRIYKRLTNAEYLTFNDLLFANLIGNQIFTSKAKIIVAGLFDEEIKAAQDYDMWLRLLQNGQKAKIIKEALQVIYIGHDSITMSKYKFFGYFQVYKKYKKYLSKEQKKYWLLNFYYWRDKKIGYVVALKLLPMHFKYFFISIAKVIKVNRI